MDKNPFDQIDGSLSAGDPGEVVDQLAGRLADQGDYRGLLDAMLLRTRLDLGLSLVRPVTIGDLPEPTRTRYEDRYVAAIREVGGLILAAGEIGAAWAYCRAIGEPESVVAAINAFEPTPDDFERLNEVIDVALGQGVHPERGFDLILDHHGTCSALTAFESLPPTEATRRHAATRLIRRLHADLLTNLSADLLRRGEAAPGTAAISDWLDGRDWLFADDAYHLDVSHLAMIVRLSLLVTDPEAIRLAIDLTDYGRRLSPRLTNDGEPPFDDFYPDHATYLRALLGEGVEAAVAHFRSKVSPPDPSNCEAPIKAQTLVRLLDRLGRTDEAFEVAAEHLAHLPDGVYGEPSLSRLGHALGQLDRLAELARTGADPVRYAALRLEQRIGARNAAAAGQTQAIS